MRPAKVEPGDSHVRENCKGADFLQDIRLSRRLIRKHNANRRLPVYETRTSVKICGKRATENDSEMLEEVDVDYKYFLDILADRIYYVSDDDMGCSDVDNNIKHNSFNDDGVDSQYKMFLESLREDGNSYVLDVVVDNQFQHVRYEKEEEKLCDEHKSDTQKMSKDFKCREETRNLGTMGSDPKIGERGSLMETAKTLEARRDVPGKEGKSLLVGQNFQVSDVSCVAKKKSNSEVECDTSDEDYQSFLDSDMVDDGNLVCMSKKGMKKKCKGSDSNKRPRSYVSCVAKKSNSEVECDPADEDYQQFLDSDMVDDENLVCMSKHGIKRKCEGSNSGREKTGSPTESGNNLKSEGDVTGKEGKSMLVGQNLQVSNGVIRANKTPSSHVSCVARHKSNSEVECDPEDEDYQLFLDSDMVDDGSFVCIPKRVTERKCEGSDSRREKIGSPTESGKNLKSVGDVAAKEGKFSFLRQNLQVSDWVILPSSNRSCSDISSVAKHKCHSEVQWDTVDEDYQEFLSFTRIDGENLVFMPNSSITKVYEEDDCCSSDSELVIMESDPYHENTPFISSKTYDSSWFADEGNHGDNWLVSATRDSQFRKGLTEFLERPYDQGEYERYLQEISCRKQKERHRETRSGEIESCPIAGFNKSYLELHRDLKKAIDGVKEQHKVLFLLRGYFYWLKNLTQEGSFQPWSDASCLEMLTKM